MGEGGGLVVDSESMSSLCCCFQWTKLPLECYRKSKKGDLEFVILIMERILDYELVNAVVI